MSTAHVDAEDRYTLCKVPAVTGPLEDLIPFSSHLSHGTGFYTVVYRIGYRQTFDVKVRVLPQDKVFLLTSSQVDAFIDQICELETREDPQRSAATIADIRTAAQRVTHMYGLLHLRMSISDEKHSVPHYVVSSKKLGSSQPMKCATWIRAVLIEDIYRRLGQCASLLIGTYAHGPQSHHVSRDLWMAWFGR